MRTIRLFENLFAPTGTLTSDATNPSDGDTFTLGDVIYTFKTTLTTTGVGGTVANEIKIGADAATTLDNVKSAVNASAGAGTAYSTGTVANNLANATTNTDTTQLFVPNSGVRRQITLTENSSHLSVDSDADGKFKATYTQTAGTVNQDFKLPDGAKGLNAILHIAAKNGTLTHDVKFQYADGQGNFVDVPGASFAQQSNTATLQLSIYPGLTAASNVAVTQILTRRLRAVSTVGGSGSPSSSFTLDIQPVF